MNWGIGLVVVAALGLPWTAQARDLFAMTVTTEGITESQSFDTFDDIFSAFDNAGFAAVNDAYTATSPAVAAVDLRGLPIEAIYPDSSTLLVFRIPSIGLERTFQGVTRDESQEQLKQFLESNQDGLLTDLLQELVRLTPIDPVAGNPNSLQAQMIAADFAAGTTVGPTTSFRAGDEDEEEAEVEPPRLVSLNPQYGRYTAEGFGVNVVNLPLGYAIPLADPRWAVILDLPLTYIDTEDASSYAVSGGIGLRMPILDNWQITPMFRVGSTGSYDLGALAVIVGGSVVSNLEFAIGRNVLLTLGNALSGLGTLPIEAGDYDFSYDLTNGVSRNGFALEGETGQRLFGQAVSWELSAVNTQFFGDEVYIENYTDLALSFGTKARQAGVVWDSFRLGFTYTLTDRNYDGFRLNFGYQF